MILLSNCLLSIELSTKSLNDTIITYTLETMFSNRFIFKLSSLIMQIWHVETTSKKLFSYLLWKSQFKKMKIELSVDIYIMKYLVNK